MEEILTQYACLMHLRSMGLFARHGWQALDECLERKLIKHSKAAAGRRNTAENVIANISNARERNTAAEIMLSLVGSPDDFLDGGRSTSEKEAPLVDRHAKRATPIYRLMDRRLGPEGVEFLGQSHREEQNISNIISSPPLSLNREATKEVMALRETGDRIFEEFASRKSRITHFGDYTKPSSFPRSFAVKGWTAAHNAEKKKDKAVVGARVKRTRKAKITKHATLVASHMLTLGPEAFDDELPVEQREEAKRRLKDFQQGFDLVSIFPEAFMTSGSSEPRKSTKHIALRTLWEELANMQGLGGSEGLPTSVTQEVVSVLEWNGSDAKKLPPVHNAVNGMHAVHGPPLPASETVGAHARATAEKIMRARLRGCGSRAVLSQFTSMTPPTCLCRSLGSRRGEIRQERLQMTSLLLLRLTRLFERRREFRLDFQLLLSKLLV